MAVEIWEGDEGILVVVVLVIYHGLSGALPALLDGWTAHVARDG